MTPASSYTEWLIRVLAFVGGAGSTVVGSWISSKIRLYHDDQKSHHQELKQKVLLPLRDFLAEHQPLFGHRVPVLTEEWGRSTMPILDARPDQDAFESGAFLHVNNPWPAAFSGLDRALSEDAKRVHYEKLMSDVAELASSWEEHTAHCSIWVEKMGIAILDASSMNTYQPPYQPPYVNHLRLAVWIYRRLFHLPTEALRQSNQGQYWSIEGAPTVPTMPGNATLAKEDHNRLLLEAIEKITQENRERAVALRREAEAIANQAGYLRSKLEYEMAKKKLRKHCDLVRFF